MKKEEIIQALADCTIPEGATLTERTLTSGFTVARITSGHTGGLNIMAARMLANALRTQTAELPDKPDAVLLGEIHKAIVSFDKATLDALTIPTLEQAIIENHRTIVGKLRQIAQELKIVYTEPEDNLLT